MRDISLVGSFFYIIMRGGFSVIRGRSLNIRGRGGGEGMFWKCEAAFYYVRGRHA